MGKGTNTEGEVYQLNQSGKTYSKPRPKSKTGGTNQKAKPRTNPRAYKCYRCGQEGHFGRDPICPAHNARCTKCNKIGHLAPVCHTREDNSRGGKPWVAKSKSTVQVASYVEESDEEEEDSVFGMYSVAGEKRRKPIQVPLKLGVCVTFGDC